MEQIENKEIIQNIDIDNEKKLITSKGGKVYIIKNGKRYLQYEKKGPKQSIYNDEQKKNRLYASYIKMGLKKMDPSELTKDEKDELLKLMIAFQVKLL